MKFSSLQIQRYGGWSNLDLDRFSAGLNVVFGARGSGKGAIVDFLSAMLYGPPRLLQESLLRRPADPTLDGALTVEDRGHRRVIRRQTRNRGLSVAPRAEGRNPQQELQSLLEAADRSVYEQIYSIDFRRLRSIRPLLQAAWQAGRDLTHAADLAPTPATPTEKDGALWQGARTPQTEREALRMRRQELVARIEQEELRQRHGAAPRQQLAQLDKAIYEHRRAMGDLHHDFGTEAWQSTAPPNGPRHPQTWPSAAWVEAFRKSLAHGQQLLTAVRREYVPGIWPSSAEPRQTLDRLWVEIDRIRHEASQLTSHESQLQRGAIVLPWIATLESLQDDLGRLRQSSLESKTSGSARQPTVAVQRLSECESEISQLLTHLAELPSQAEAPAASVDRPAWDTFMDDPANQHWPSRPSSQRSTRNAARAQLARELDDLISERDRLAADLSDGFNEAALARCREELQSIDRALHRPENPSPSRLDVSERLEAIEQHVRRTMQPLDDNPLTRSASHLLSQLTGGAHERLWFSHDSMLWIEGRVDRARIPYSQLTRTERCLVYLSIALAIVNARRKAGRHLPLVINDDDLTLNQQQATALYDVLAAETRDGQQVLLFTVHRELLHRENRSGIRLFELQDPRKTNVEFETVELPSQPKHVWVPVPAVPAAEGEVHDGSCYPTMEGAAAGTSGPWSEEAWCPSDSSAPTWRRVDQPLGREYRGHSPGPSPQDGWPTVAWAAVPTPPTAQGPRPASQQGHTLRARDPVPAIPYLSDAQARQLQTFGLRTVRDFQRCPAERIAQHLRPWNVSGQRVARWQLEVGLLVQLRSLHPREAQWLYSAGVKSVSDLAAMDVDELVRRITSSNVGGPWPLLGDSEAGWLRMRADQWIQNARRRSQVPADSPPTDTKLADVGHIPDGSRAFAWTESCPTARLPWLQLADTEALRGLGVRTVGDLIHLDANGHVSPSDAGLSARQLQRWQAAAELGCRIPGIDAEAARCLSECGVRGVTHLARFDTAGLSRRLNRYFRSKRQHRRRGGQRQYPAARLAVWIRGAQDWGRPRPNSATKPDRQPWAGSLSRALAREEQRTKRDRTGSRDGADEQARRNGRQATDHALQGAPQRPAPRFYLRPSDDVVDAPSIGGKTAERLQAVGIRTVEDLLRSDPVQLEKRLNQKRMRATKIRDWQAQASLVCQVPFLRGHDAQILVACNVREPQQLATIAPPVLWEQVQPLLQSNEGRRIVRGGKTPDLAEVTQWTRWAQQAHALEAA